MALNSSIKLILLLKILENAPHTQRLVLVVRCAFSSYLIFFEYVFMNYDSYSLPFQVSDGWMKFWLTILSGKHMWSSFDFLEVKPCINLLIFFMQHHHVFLIPPTQMAVWFSFSWKAIQYFVKSFSCKLNLFFWGPFALSLIRALSICLRSYGPYLVKKRLIYSRKQWWKPLTYYMLIWLTRSVEVVCDNLQEQDVEYISILGGNLVVTFGDSKRDTAVIEGKSFFFLSLWCSCSNVGDITLVLAV